MIKNNFLVLKIIYINYYKIEESGDKQIKEETTLETVKLPVTFDTGRILITILCGIVIAILIIAYLNQKVDKQDKNTKKDENK